MNIAVLILAAGVGKRMKSAKQKVLHEICGRPMISYIIDTVRKLEPSKIILVVGHQSELVIQSLNGRVVQVYQEKQLGTGHAVSLTKKALSGYKGPVLVMPGDTPLLRQQTLVNLIKKFESNKPAAAVLTADKASPFGYGRIVANERGIITKIVEEKDASPKERQIKTINAGVYCFDQAKLFEVLDSLSPENKQGEYYLTDVIGILHSKTERIITVRADEREILGVNSRVELAEAEGIVQDKIKQKLMEKGVSFVLPQTSFISADVDIGRDTIIYPNSFITGSTVIGEASNIGPGVKIMNSKIGSRAAIIYAVINEAVIKDEVNIGPFCSIRPGTKIEKGGKAGTFVEIKNSTVGSKSKVPHLSYFGDATIGKGVNIGAGSITCNYDGVNKWETFIDDEAFLGSDTMLIAPVKIGKKAFTAAGSSISKNVPAGSLGIERGEQKNILGWSQKHLNKSKSKQEKKGKVRRRQNG